MNNYFQEKGEEWIQMVDKDPASVFTKIMTKNSVKKLVPTLRNKLMVNNNPLKIYTTQKTNNIMVITTLVITMDLYVHVSRCVTVAKTSLQRTQKDQECSQEVVVVTAQCVVLDFSTGQIHAAKCLQMLGSI